MIRLTLALALALTPAAAQTDKIREYYKQAVVQHGIVGSSLYFMRDNEIVAREFFGFASLEHQRKVDERTIYHWASITKTFTAVAIMQLRDHGRLRLDDPVVKYVPELEAVHNRFGPMSKITIRHLLTHSAGFRMVTWPWGGDQDWHPNEPQHFSQLVAMFPYTEILFAPGSRYSYSNLGIIFLGQIIERLTTDDYEVYIDKNILKPLEMYRSYFDSTPYHLLEDRCRSYRLVNGKPVPAVFDFNTGVTVSNGGLNAPLPDMVKWINFLMGDLRQQPVYDRILKRSSLEEMFHPALPTGNPKEAMGLCFFIDDSRSKRVIHHSGTQNAFLTHFYLQPASRQACIVAFNTHAEGKEQNTRRLDQELKDYLFR